MMLHLCIFSYWLSACGFVSVGLVVGNEVRRRDELIFVDGLMRVVKRGEGWKGRR